MDIKNVLEILRLVKSSDLTEVSITEGDFSLTVKRGGETVVVQSSAPTVNYAALPQTITPQAIAPSPVPAPQAAALPEPAAPAPKAEAPASTANTHTIVSPMIGTFYRASGPDKEPYVKVGDTISKGQVICIIEAMKLFNEIESEVDGKVVKILLDNAKPVEYEQALFVVELS